RKRLTFPLTFSNPLGFLGFLSLPAILFFHFFVRQRKKKKVSALFLWLGGKKPREREGGDRKTIPPVTLSLLIELLLASLLTCFLAGIGWASSSKVHHYLFLLDGHGYMEAQNGSTTFRDQVIQKIQRQIQRAPTPLRVTLISTGYLPETLVVFADKKNALKALSSWHPKERSHSLASSLQMARELAGSSGKIIYYTARMPSPKELEEWQMEVHSVGKKLPNLAFLHGLVENLDKNKGKVILLLANFSHKPVQSFLTFFLGKKRILTKKISFKPMEKKRVFVVIPKPPSPNPFHTIRVQLEKDFFSLDNELSLVFPKISILKIYLHPSFQNNPFFRKLLSSLPFVKPSDSPSRSHLLILPNGISSPNPFATNLFIGTFDGPKSYFLGPFLVAREHSETQSLTFEGVIWMASEKVPFSSVFPLVSVGSTPLFFQYKNFY
ncbi:MAG: hypothetical protein D6785_07035, partial [Planctomycetota bacterium]